MQTGTVQTGTMQTGIMQTGTVRPSTLHHHTLRHCPSCRSAVQPHTLCRRAVRRQAGRCQAVKRHIPVPARQGRHGRRGERGQHGAARKVQHGGNLARPPPRRSNRLRRPSTRLAATPGLRHGRNTLAMRRRSWRVRSHLVAAPPLPGLHCRPRRAQTRAGFVWVVHTPRGKECPGGLTHCNLGGARNAPACQPRDSMRSAVPVHSILGPDTPRAAPGSGGTRLPPCRRRTAPCTRAPQAHRSPQSHDEAHADRQHQRGRDSRGGPGW